MKNIKLKELYLTIEIPLEEYKELLIIKGKYEELKSYYSPVSPTKTIVRYVGPDGKPNDLTSTVPNFCNKK